MLPIAEVCLTGGNDGWLLAVVDLARSAAGGLKSLDNLQGIGVSNLAENDVLAIEPAGDNSGDEELGTVAMGIPISRLYLRGGYVEIAYVFGPALAMERSPGLVCLREKFSSANFSP
jgi:hypothetical protein